MYKVLISQIKNFIDTCSSRGALMLNGTWGSGKTYFVKNILKDELEKSGYLRKKKFIYISLYGKSSIRDVETNICLSSFKEGDSNTFIKKSYGFFKGISEIIQPNSFSLYGFSASIDISKLILGDYLTSCNDTILILDDVERCALDTKAIFGLISNIIENTNAIVILIINEEQYHYIENRKIQESDKTWNYEKIYTQVKEKSVYITLPFKIDIDIVYESVVMSRGVDGHGYLRKYKDIIINHFREKGCYNIRVLNYIFDLIEGLFTYLRGFLDELNDHEKKTLCEQLIDYIAYRGIEIKFGVKGPSWGLGEYWKFIGLERSETYTSIVAFELVDTFIEKLYLKIDEYIPSLKEIIFYNNQKDLSLQRLKYWPSLEENDFQELIHSLPNELKRDLYPIQSFKEILSVCADINYFLHDSGLDIHCIQGIMCDKIGILQSHIYIDFDTPQVPSYDLFQNYIEPIKEAIVRNNNRPDQALDLSSYFNGTKPISDLFIVVDRFIGQYIGEKRFISYLGEIDIFIDYLARCTNEDFQVIRNVLRRVYYGTGDTFKSDKALLELLRNRLKGLEETVSNSNFIKRENIKFLIQDINKYIATMSN